VRQAVDSVGKAGRAVRREVAAALSLAFAAVVLWVTPSSTTVRALLGGSLFWIGVEAAGWLAKTFPPWIRWVLVAAGGVSAGFAITGCPAGSDVC
jgi:hypothetical protein